MSIRATYEGGDFLAFFDEAGRCLGRRPWAETGIPDDVDFLRYLVACYGSIELAKRVLIDREALTPRLVYANVMDRAAVSNESLRWNSSPSIVLHFDTPTVREVRELRIFAAGGAVLSTRQLFDYDYKKAAWQTLGPERTKHIEDPRAVRDLAGLMLSELEAAGLLPYELNTATHESFYSRPQS